MCRGMFWNGQRHDAREPLASLRIRGDVGVFNPLDALDEDGDPGPAAISRVLYVTKVQ